MELKSKSLAQERFGTFAATYATSRSHAKGGSPGWHGLTYHGAMLMTRGAYACEASGRAHFVRPAAHFCRIGH